MRVISGSAKGHRLKGPPDSGTRPMIDRVKESLFAILSGYGVIRGRVLDLFAGTGALGIECLSRGAAWADFVEQRAAVCKIIRANLAHTKLTDRARVYQMPVEAFIAQVHGEPYAIIIMDPPYASPTIEATIEAIAASQLVQDGTILVVGHWPRLSLREHYGNFVQLTSRRIGDSAFSIYEFIDREASSDPPSLLSTKD
jgi:16S rRNA (guanine966-N2)-methyltransferase